jgi:triphosphatase
MPEAASRKLTADLSIVDAGGKVARAPTAEMEIGEALPATLALALRSLRGATGKGDGARAQTVHRFRVGLRRLRSLLVAFRTVLPEAERRSLGKELAAAAQRYGRVREWDVLIAGTLTPLAKALPDDRLVAEITADAAAARRRALPSDGAPGAEAAALAERVEAAAHFLWPGPEPQEIWHRPFKALAVEMLEKRHKRLRKHLKHVDLGDQPEFHKLRIDTKKIRYCIEMFIELFSEEEARAYLSRVVRVQNILGQLNDTMVAPALLAELPLSERAQGLVTGWLACDAHAARARFAKAAQRLRRAEPFWKS